MPFLTILANFISFEPGCFTLSSCKLRYEEVLGSPLPISASLAAEFECQVSSSTRLFLRKVSSCSIEREYLVFDIIYGRLVAQTIKICNVSYFTVCLPTLNLRLERCCTRFPKRFIDLESFGRPAVGSSDKLTHA